MNTFTTYRNNIAKVCQLLIMSGVMLILQSCSTGIESTKKIRMSKEDMKMMEKTPEQNYAAGIQGTPLSEWNKGKLFLAMSDRTEYIFEQSPLVRAENPSSLKGKTLTYEGVESHLNPDLKEECVILFSDGENLYKYHTGKLMEEALSSIESNRLPLISDLSLIDLWKEKLKGATLWTRSNLWYDEEGERIEGQKFVKVEVTGVEPQAGDFPIRVAITTQEGRKGFMQMNYTADPHDSRNFAAIFFLSDPRLKYPQINDEHWVLIQNGKVDKGMTKEECKLSIGNPDEVYAGHSRSETMDFWQYSNGTSLMFTDGLLTSFRQ